MKNNAATFLHNLLITRDFDPTALDASTGKPPVNQQGQSDLSDANMWSFDYQGESGKNYGTVVLLLNNDNNLQVYFGDNLGRAMESEDKQSWYKFLEQLKDFAVRNMLTFDLQNLNRLKYTMQGMAAIQEGLFEGYYGTRKMSYSDQPKQVKLVIKHNRSLDEGDARFRHIESLFVETADGERFKVPGRNLNHGKMLARHVAEGGTPYDAFGQHINQIIQELATLSRFMRAAKSRKFNDEAQSLLETSIRHYQDLKAKAKRMISQRGYRDALAEFDPTGFTDSEVTTEAIRDMFLEQVLDHRIEDALPILARMSSSDTAMKEISAFESWADNLVEGTWSVPEGPEAIARFKQLMADPLPVGPDATNATEQLYDLLGDDQLFDELSELARMDANTDARPAISRRLKELGFSNLLPNDKEPDVQEDLDVDGVMMTRPSNMSS